MSLKEDIEFIQGLAKNHPDVHLVVKNPYSAESIGMFCVGLFGGAYIGGVMVRGALPFAIGIMVGIAAGTLNAITVGEKVIPLEKVLSGNAKLTKEGMIFCKFARELSGGDKCELTAFQERARLYDVLAQLGYHPPDDIIQQERI